MKCILECQRQKKVRSHVFPKNVESIFLMVEREWFCLIGVCLCGQDEMTHKRDGGQDSSTVRGEITEGIVKM